MPSSEAEEASFFNAFLALSVPPYTSNSCGVLEIRNENYINIKCSFPRSEDLGHARAKETPDKKV